MSNPVRLNSREVRRRASAGQMCERLDGLISPRKKEEKVAKEWTEGE
jgi:hypothetical protein